MKKMLLVFIILLISASAFADFRIGPTGFMNFPFEPEDYYAVPELVGRIDPTDFNFGVEARLKLLIFQASATLLYTPRARIEEADGTIWVAVPSSTDLYLDAGLAFDIAFLRLGIGIGPNFTFFWNETTYVNDQWSMGFNAKATVDFLLGPVSVGLNYINQFDVDLQHPDSFVSHDKTQGLLGVAVLFKL